MKLKMVALFFITSLLLVSCSGENLYEFEELSDKEEFIVEVVAVPRKVEEPMLCWVVFHETDGYGDVFKSSRGTGGIAPFQIFNNAVKAYKKVGVNVVPEENVRAFQVRIYNLQTGTDYFVQLFENPEEEVIVTYDFDKNEILVE